MKHEGKQGKSLGCKVPGYISIIGFCVLLKFVNPPPLEIESPPSVKKAAPRPLFFISGPSGGSGELHSITNRFITTYLFILSVE